MTGTTILIERLYRASLVLSLVSLLTFVGMVTLIGMDLSVVVSSIVPKLLLILIRMQAYEASGMYTSYIVITTVFGASGVSSIILDRIGWNMEKRLMWQAIAALRTAGYSEL